MHRAANDQLPAHVGAWPDAAPRANIVKGLWRSFTAASPSVSLADKADIVLTQQNRDSKA